MEWEAEYAMQPFGPALVDAHFGQLCAILANVHSDPKRGRRYKAKDFMLRREVETPEMLAARIKATIAGRGGQADSI